MALTLAANLGVPTTLDPAIELTVTGTVPAGIVPGYQFRLGDEVLELRYFGETQQTILGGAATQTVDDRNTWYAQRGVAGTTIATHTAGTAVLGVADALVAGTDEDLPVPPFGAAGAALAAHAADTTAVHGIVDTAALLVAVPTLAEVLAVSPVADVPIEATGGNSTIVAKDGVDPRAFLTLLATGGDGSVQLATEFATLLMSSVGGDGSASLATATAGFTITAASVIRIEGPLGAVIISADGSIAIDSGAVSMAFLPTADPAVAGQLWVDAADSFRVKQSQGA